MNSAGGMPMTTIQRLQNEYRTAMGNGDVPAMLVALRKIDGLRTADRLRRTTESTRRLLAQVRLLP